MEAWLIAVVDTCCDPTPVDYVIPGNDDAAKSVSVILDALCGAIKEGLEERKLEKDKEEEAREAENAASGKKMRPRKGGAPKAEAAAPAVEAAPAAEETPSAEPAEVKE